MDVLGKITAQIEVVGLPLVAVSLTALPCANTPVMLMLHWHGFRQSDDATPHAGSRSVPVPGSTLQLSDLWQETAHLDEAMLDAAWQLGAWDLVREEKRGCNTAGASEREALECRQAFGEHPMGLDADELMVTQAPDQTELRDLGAKVGYIRWQFRPVKNGLWHEVSSDDTLVEDGSRVPPCPVGSRPTIGTRLIRTQYRLGHSSRIFLM